LPELAKSLQANLPFPVQAIHVTPLYDDQATRKGVLDALLAIIISGDRELSHHAPV